LTGQQAFLMSSQLVNNLKEDTILSLLSLIKQMEGVNKVITREEIVAFSKNKRETD